jgi:serine/threonine-protein kinase HipA
MEREIHVHIDVAHQPVLVGRLWMRERKDKETATFAYDPSWLRRAGAFPLAPGLALTPGPFQSEGLFSIFSDAAPDAWGRKLMRHYERERATASNQRARTLFDSHFLLGVNDEIRMGALRFKLPNDDKFMSYAERAVPLLVDIRKLLSATDRIEKGKPRKSDLNLLLAPAGSLGGMSLSRWPGWLA